MMHHRQRHRAHEDGEVAQADVVEAGDRKDAEELQRHEGRARAADCPLPESFEGPFQTFAVSSRGLDVLVHMQQTVRIILFFDPCQAIIVGAVRGGDPIAFFFGREVHVCTFRGVRGRGLDQKLSAIASTVEHRRVHRAECQNGAKSQSDSCLEQHPLCGR